MLYREAPANEFPLNLLGSTPPKTQQEVPTAIRND